MSSTPPDERSSGLATEVVEVVEHAPSDQTPNGLARLSRLMPTRPPRLDGIMRVDMRTARELLGRLHLLRSNKKLSARELLEIELRIFSKMMQITISFVNFKGGASKTTTALYCGSIHADTTRDIVFLLPACRAVETSTAGFNAGIRPEDEPLTISEFAELFRSLGSYRSISHRVPKTPWGLRVISEPNIEGEHDYPEFDLEQFINVSDTLHPAADVMIYDAGNDSIRGGSIVLEAIRRSHVIVYTGTADKVTTLEKLAENIRRTIVAGQEQDADLTREGPLTETEIPIAAKALNPIVAISGVGRRQTPEDFLPYLRDIENFAGTIECVPHDRYIQHNPVVAPDHIASATYDAYLRILVEAYRRAAKLAGVDLSKLEAELELTSAIST